MITSLIVKKNDDLVVSYLATHDKYILDGVASETLYCVYIDGKVNLDFSKYTYKINSNGELIETLKET